MQNLIHVALTRARCARYYGPIGFFFVTLCAFLYGLVLPLDYPYLFSATYPVLETSGTLFLLFAPPLGVFLAMRHWMLTGRGFLSLLTIATGAPLTVLTIAALLLAFVG